MSQTEPTHNYRSHAHSCIITHKYSTTHSWHRTRPKCPRIRGLVFCAVQYPRSAGELENLILTFATVLHVRNEDRRHGFTSAFKILATGVTATFVDVENTGTVEGAGVTVKAYRITNKGTIKISGSNSVVDLILAGCHTGTVELGSGVTGTLSYQSNCEVTTVTNNAGAGVTITRTGAVAEVVVRTTVTAKETIEIAGGGTPTGAQLMAAPAYKKGKEEGLAAALGIAASRVNVTGFVVTAVLLKFCSVIANDHHARRIMTEEVRSSVVLVVVPVIDRQNRCALCAARSAQRAGGIAGRGRGQRATRSAQGVGWMLWNSVERCTRAVSCGSVVSVLVVVLVLL